MWILPQTQNPELLFLGVSAEEVPSGLLDGPISIRLLRFEGPGYFMMWQATGPGQFNIRVDTRDGLTGEDVLTPLVGSHEHLNWGFSTSGVYCTTWQVSGRRLGQTTNITSLETTFLFHVLPLPVPATFAQWQKSFWPPDFNPSVTASNANPDGDQLNNFLEYALLLSPTNANLPQEQPCFSLPSVPADGYATCTFPRNIAARDLRYIVEASSDLPGTWTPLTNVIGMENLGGSREKVTLRDHVPASSVSTRFLRLRIEGRSP